MKHLKLRWFILVLMVLNALFYVWRTGGFEPWDGEPESAREPERLQQQINPDNIVITRKNT
jgi:hypothetical protein